MFSSLERSDRRLGRGLTGSAGQDHGQDIPESDILVFSGERSDRRVSGGLTGPQLAVRPVALQRLFF